MKIPPEATVNKKKEFYFLMEFFVHLLKMLLCLNGIMQLLIPDALVGICITKCSSLSCQYKVHFSRCLISSSFFSFSLESKAVPYILWRRLFFIVLTLTFVEIFLTHSRSIFSPVTVNSSGFRFLLIWNRMRPKVTEQ